MVHDVVDLGLVEASTDSWDGNVIGVWLNQISVRIKFCHYQIERTCFTVVGYFAMEQ